jgi:hypothetical protein
MIANLALILSGLWLAYHAIFSIPAGGGGPISTTAAGVAVILLAAWARRTDVMGWPSGTNIALGVVMLALAAAQGAVGLDPPASLWSFWVLLLAGITIAIAALWSILYRPEPA